MKTEHDIIDPPGAGAAVINPIKGLKRVRIRIELGYKFILSFLVVIAGVIVVTRIIQGIDIPRAWEETVTVLTAIAMGLAIGRTFTRTLSRDFRRISHAAEEVADGDLGHPLSLEDRMFPDETADLSESVNKMRHSLRVLVSRIKETSSQVLESSRGLFSSAQEVNASSEEISKTMEQIAKGASLQAELVEKASSLIKRMATSMEQVSASAGETRVSAGAANDAARKGEEIVRTTIGKMTGVFEKVEEAHSRVFAFSEKVAQIKKIVEIITGIAEKTNLLALNATIEAARAGEYGRGFAVVAEEIRKLADTSATSAEQIGHVIESIDAESRSVGGSISDSTQDLRRGREEMEAIRRSLESIHAGVGEAAQKSEGIARLSGDQAAHADEAVKSIEEIARVAEDNAAATEQVSAAVQEQTASVSEMSSAAHALTRMSEDLKGIVSKFTLE